MMECCCLFAMCRMQCNYGNIGFPFDKWFGTIRHHIGDESDYQGQGDASAKKNDGDAILADAAAAAAGGGGGKKQAALASRRAYLRGSLTLRGALPARSDHAAYWLFTATLPVVLFAAVAKPACCTAFLTKLTPATVAAYLSVGPAIAALVLSVVMRDRRSPRWPFHKEGIVGSFGWHLFMCVMTIVLPTYHTVETLLADRCAGSLAALLPSC